MNATLTITGDLAALGRLAQQIDEWVPGAFSTAVETPAFEGWDVEKMTMLLRRLQPKQLDLLSFLTEGGGYRGDEEVRGKFANAGGGMKGLTGPISKHIKAMTEAGLLPNDASYVVRTESHPANRNAPGGFRTPIGLVPVIRAAIASL